MDLEIGDRNWKVKIKAAGRKVKGFRSIGNKYPHIFPRDYSECETLHYHLDYLESPNAKVMQMFYKVL